MNFLKGFGRQEMACPELVKSLTTMNMHYLAYSDQGCCRYGDQQWGWCKALRSNSSL